MLRLAALLSCLLLLAGSAAGPAAGVSTEEISPSVGDAAATASIKPLRVTSDEGVYSTVGHLQLLPDPEGRLGIDDIRSPPWSAAFAPARTEMHNLGFD
ncbi:MAG: hypothetical protein ACLFTD_11890, partial [Halochromatium sp.]